MEVANAFAAAVALTSGQSGMTATTRGTPSVPQKALVAARRSFRFFNWSCFALFCLSCRVWDAFIAALAAPLGVTREALPFACFLVSPLEACLDLNFLFCCLRPVLGLCEWLMMVVDNFTAFAGHWAEHYWNHRTTDTPHHHIKEGPWKLLAGISRQLMLTSQDLRGEIIQWLEQMITDNGGQVLRQVPLNGYVLIDPTSERGQKLARKWSDDAKPNRQVVCWTFVPGSVTAGNRLSAKAMQGVVPIFLNQGIPIGFTLDDNLGQNLIGELRLKITKYGGNLVKKYSEARVILTNDTKPSFEVLLERFRHDNDTYVEPPSWFDRCIAFGRYEHAAPPPKIVGGRRPGASRNEYCAEDDQLLAEYIATRIPSNDMRGRTGNGLYKELCERVDLYPWATRHPWNSWRNRYKTKRDRLDQMIDEWLEENPQPTGGKGQYIIKLTKALAEHEDQHGSSRVSTGDPGGSVAAGKRQKKDINEDPGSERRAWKRTKSMSLDMQEDEDNAEVEEVMDAEALMLNHLSKVATAPSI